VNTWSELPVFYRGILTENCVFFLVSNCRYGGERYEKRDMQLRVREQFRALEKIDNGRIPWKVIDAAQSVEEVEADIWNVVCEVMENISNQEKPVGKMWQDGFYDLTSIEPSTDDKENKIQ